MVLLYASTALPARMSRVLLSCCLLLLLLLLLLSPSHASGGRVSEDDEDDNWLIGLRSLIKGCPVRSAKLGDKKKTTPAHGFVRSLCECAGKRAWMAIDHILEDDVVPVVGGLDLVRFKDEGGLAERPVNSSVTYHIRKSLERTHDRGQIEPSDSEAGWREKLGNRLVRVLRTHVIKIDVDRLRADLVDIAAPNGGTTIVTGRSGDGQVEGRGRRRRKRQMQMMPIIMMGMLLMGSVLIPMGFQFLAVLGGKALILAKMALMLSSIQGLKKIATSGVNYGLYHTSVPEAWHERSGALDIPYDSYHIAPPGQSPEFASGPGPYYSHYARRSAAVQPT